MKLAIGVSVIPAPRVAARGRLRAGFRTGGLGSRLSGNDKMRGAWNGDETHEKGMTVGSALLHRRYDLRHYAGGKGADCCLAEGLSA